MPEGPPRDGMWVRAPRVALLRISRSATAAKGRKECRMYSVEASEMSVTVDCKDYCVTVTRVTVGRPDTVVAGKISVWYEDSQESQWYISRGLEAWIASRKEENVRFEIYRLLKEAIADAADLRGRNLSPRSWGVGAGQAQSWDEAAADAAAAALIEAERAAEAARMDAWLAAERAAVGC